MGRTVKTTATTKAVITNRVPAALTSVYTNNTGRGAELRAVNINGTGDPTNFITSTGGNDWTFFGSNVNPFNQAAGASSCGFGVPYPVQLSDNRVLIFFLPHLQHQGGDGADYMSGNKVHCQILEYQTNKYVAGPITTIQLPDSPYTDITYSFWSIPNNFSGSFGQASFRAKALSTTKVVFGYRVRNNFRLCRATITGNAVDHTIESLNLTGATFFNTTNNQAWDLETVPGNANKCVVGGWATSNWSLMAFNIPDSGTLSAATTLVSTGIPVSNYRFSIARMSKTATANVTNYIIAASTSATAGNAIIFNYNSGTDTWTAGSTAASLPTASSEWSGIQCGCMSTGTSINAVVAMTSTGNPGVMTFIRQTSSTVVNNSSTTVTLQHSTNSRSISESFQWGDERHVFMGDGSTLVCYNSAGTATNLLPNTETTATDRNQQQWYPFNSRPLYNLYDPSTIYTERNHQWISREDMDSATSVGVSQVRGNYFPYGHDYGVGYAWNEPAGCWIVGQNGRIYALDSAGVIQSEVSLYELDGSNMDWQWHMNQLTCGPSGRIYCQADYRICVWPGGAYNCWNTWNNFSDTNRMFVIEAISSPTDLNRAFLVATATNQSMHLGIHCATVIEANTAKTERAIFFSMNSTGGPQGYFTQWTGTSWSNIGGTSISTSGTNSWHRGFRPNYKIIQDTPCSTAYPLGLWRIVGSFAQNSSANYRFRGISNAFAYTSPGSFNTTQNAIDTTTQSTEGYGVTASTYTSGNRAGTTGPTSQIMVCAMYHETRGTVYVWGSLNQRLRFVRAWQPQPSATSFPIDNTKRFPKCTATKFGYSVTIQNTSTSAGTAVSYVFDNINYAAPKFTLTSSSGNGWMQAYQKGKTSWQHYGGGVDTIYSVSGIPDTVKFFLALYDGSSERFYLNNGQTLDLNSSAAGLYRSEDVYVIPAGYSLEVQADTPNSISSLLSIDENI